MGDFRRFEDQAFADYVARHPDHEALTIPAAFADYLDEQKAFGPVITPCRPCGWWCRLVSWLRNE